MAGSQVVVSITGNAKGLQQALGNSQSALGKFGKVAGAVGLAAGAAIAAIGISAFKSVAELERLDAQTAAALKSTGNAAGRTLGQLKANADALEQLTGVGDEVIKSGQNMLLTFTQIQGVNFDKATAAALDLSVAMGTDMKSASILVGKALNDPIKGISALSRVGVQLTADQKAAVEQMVALGDTAGAQAVILGVLNEQFGGSAEAFGDTFLGRLEKVKNSFGNITEALVVGLLPGASAALGGINDKLVALGDSPAFNKIVDKIGAFTENLFSGNLDFSTIFSDLLTAAVSGIQNVATWLATGGAASLAQGFVESRTALFGAALEVFPVILRALVQIIPTLLNGIVTMVIQLAVMLAGSLPVILSAALQLFSGLLDALLAVLPSIINALLTLLPVLISTVLGMLPTLLDAAVELFTTLVEALPVILPLLVTAITTLLPKIIQTVLGLIPRVLDAAIKLFTALVKSLPIILPLLITAIITLLPKILSSVLGMIPKLLDAAVRLFTGLVEAVPKIIPALIPAIVKLLPKMIGALVGMIPTLVKAGVDLIGGLIRGLVRAGGSVGKALIDIASSAVKGFLSFLGIKSPSRLFAGFGKDTVKGLVKGLEQNASLVDRSMVGLSTRVADGFSPTFGTPDLGFASGAAGGASSSAAVYNITVNTLNANAETGRVIVQSIREYEGAGGRL